MLMLQSSLRRQLLTTKLARRGAGGQGRTIATAAILPLSSSSLSSSSSSSSSSRLTTPLALAATTFRIATTTNAAGPYRGFTTTSSAASQGFHHQQNPDPYQLTQQPSRSRRVLRWFFRTLFILGTGAALAVVAYQITVVNSMRSEPLEKDSPKDLRLRANITAAAAKLPLVVSLLASPEWSSSPPSYSEQQQNPESGSGGGRHHEAYAAIPADARPTRLTTGPLGTADGVGGYQHVFHNATTGEVLTVVYIGGATTGWPLVVHGGLIATLLDEQCARAAMDDVSFAGGGSNKKGIVTARLEVDYRRVVFSRDFYAVRARAVPEEELDEAERGKRDRKVWVRTTLENVNGQVYVEGSALYVKPAGINLRTVGEDF